MMPLPPDTRLSAAGVTPLHRARAASRRPEHSRLSAGEFVRAAQYPQRGPFPTHSSHSIVVQSARSNVLGVAGFVTGLSGLIFFRVPALGLILGSLGVILGGAAYSAARKAGSSNGLAIAGLVLGIVSLIPAIIVLTAPSNPRL
jgi:hypothetical protein